MVRVDADRVPPLLARLVRFGAFGASLGVAVDAVLARERVAAGVAAAVRTRVDASIWIQVQLY